MRDDITVFVDCLRDDKVIRTYDFLCSASLAAAPVVPPNAHIIEQAKTNLTNERLAVPPYAGMTFRIRR
jgi:hypothetical protein